jgi:alkylation response protein AidB-like acyl-CoA dehydrogenase
MRFALSDEQRQFGTALHGLLSDADVPGAARAWGTGDRAPGLAIWRALAKAGVTSLLVPPACGGLGADPVDLVVACEELGHHPVPGPVAESIAAIPVLLSSLGRLGHSAAAETTAGCPSRAASPGWLPGLASGDLIATLAIPPALPYALDADAAGLVLLADGDRVWRAERRAGLESIDPVRRLFEVWPAQAIATGPDVRAAVTKAVRYGTLASAALLLGAGRGLLDATARHARTREQFGSPIGAFQAVKHSLAGVLIALEFARPLLFAAAIAAGGETATAARDVSAARVACADAARLAARSALQVHGAIGYTRECDVSLWLAKVRALSSTWGSQAEHRAIVLAALAEPETGPWS